MTRPRDTSDTVPTIGVPSAPPLPVDLEQLLRRLRLPHVRRHEAHLLVPRGGKWRGIGGAIGCGEGGTDRCLTV